MEFTQVISTTVAEVAYEKDTLYIRFTNGRLYKYDDVPKELYHNLINAESIGKFFHGYIKRNFVCTELPRETV